MNQQVGRLDGDPLNNVFNRGPKEPLKLNENQAITHNAPPGPSRRGSL